MENTLPAIDYSDRETIETLKRTVAQGATDEEFRMFAELCKATGLNPFKREVWFIKAGGRAQIMTGINGYLAVANRHPQFDGMEVSLEWDGSALRSATCKVYRKDRKFPSIATAIMSEWAGNTPIWKTKPSVMLAKVAKSIAIREAFSLELAGTYTEDEMPKNFSAPIEVKVEALTVKPADQLPPGQTYRYDISEIEEQHLAKAWEYLRENGAEQLDLNLWLSPKKLKKLERYLITETQAEAAAA